MEESADPEKPINICEDGFPSESEPGSEKEKNWEESNASGEPAAVPLVLEPDHPMMERFQAALKTHLLKQLEKLTNQVQAMENEVKMKEKEKEETGVELYAMQQEIYRQQKTLEDYENEVENLMKERQCLDESVSCKKTNWKEEVNALNCAKKKESEMMVEFYKLSSLEKQMEQWEKEMESELTVSQRITEKTQQDKYKLVEEKRKMDMYLLRLMTAVSNSESEIKYLEGEIDVKLEEKDQLNQTLADATADLQCLITEQKRLFSAWNSVVCTINQRSLIYSNIAKELAKCQEGFRSLNAEIEGYKRSAAEEMKKSEKLALVYGRLQSDNENSEMTLKNLMGKKLVMENKLTSMAAMIERTEADYQHTKADTDNLKKHLNILENSIDNFSKEKQSIEDEIINFIQNQILNDKRASHLNKLLRKAREKTRKVEFSLLENENKISQKFLEIEELKETVSRNNEIIKEINTEFNNKEEELKKYNDELAKFQSMILQKQGNYATLTKKVEKLMEKNMQKHDENLPQQRIIKLEKINSEIQTKNDKLQSFWLLQQSNNVKLTKQRSEQLKVIDLLKKQVSLLEHKALKIDVELDREKKTENDINKSILQLQNKLTVLNKVLVGKKDQEENVGKKNTIVQAQFVQDLKDAELEQIRLKAEINELEMNIEELAEGMLSTQREMLAWEKKIKSALEAKNEMQKERSSSGEVGQMKAEIHRMEVRCSQLKRAQEKLTTDLEQCVLRRDAIFDGVDLIERQQARGLNTRITLQKKIEDLKNNLRTLCNEKKQIEKLIKNTEDGHKELKKTIAEKEKQLAEMEETTKKMNQQLQEGKIQKTQNLEMLIRRQKKCKLYELVKSGKHRMLFKSEDIIEREMQKVKNTNTELVSVVETLIENFPAHYYQLKKISNTLQAKPS